MVKTKLTFCVFTLTKRLEPKTTPAASSSDAEPSDIRPSRGSEYHLDVGGVVAARASCDVISVRHNDGGRRGDDAPAARSPSLTVRNNKIARSLLPGF